MTARKAFTLTGNDLALCENGMAHAINFFKAMRPQGAWARKERQKYEALLKKLNAITDHAYPYDNSDEMPLDVGDEPIMRSDQNAMGSTRARAAWRAS